jgi:hypothetical protein
MLLRGTYILVVRIPNTSSSLLCFFAIAAAVWSFVDSDGAVGTDRRWEGFVDGAGAGELSIRIGTVAEGKGGGPSGRQLGIRPANP